MTEEIRQQPKMQPKQPHNVIMEDRRNLTVSGVKDVDSFDEQTMIIYTDMGEMTVRGTELHINRLNTKLIILTLHYLYQRISQSHSNLLLNMVSTLLSSAICFVMVKYLFRLMVILNEVEEQQEKDFAEITLFLH